MLNPYQNQLLILKAKLAVKAKQEQLFTSYSEDIDKMLQLLDSYLNKGNLAIAEVESMPSDAEEDDVQQAMVGCKHLLHRAIIIWEEWRVLKRVLAACLLRCGLQASICV